MKVAEEFRGKKTHSNNKKRGKKMETNNNDKAQKGGKGMRKDLQEKNTDETYENKGAVRSSRANNKKKLGP